MVTAVQKGESWMLSEKYMARAVRLDVDGSVYLPVLAVEFNTAKREIRVGGPMVDWVAERVRDLLTDMTELAGWAVEYTGRGSRVWVSVGCAEAKDFDLVRRHFKERSESFDGVRTFRRLMR